MIHSEILASSNDPGRDGAAGHVHAPAEKVSSGKYSITVDPQTAFVRITLDGFFALSDVQEFAAGGIAVERIARAERFHG